jgi:hypothetical protein
MSDPLTREHEAAEESILELEQRAIEKQAETRRNAQDEISVMDLEAKLMDQTPPPPDLDLEDDGWVNNTWEVTGSAVEQAAEQVLRTAGDLTSFAEDWGGKIVLADDDFINEEGETSGIPIPFTTKRLDWMNNETFQAKAIQYEIATGKHPMNLSNIDFPDVDRPDSAMGQMTSGFMQWAVVFAATRKAGMGNISGAIVADFAAFDPHEARLADLARTWGEGNPVFDNAFTEYMSADPTDPALEGRLKNALEGVLIGGAIEGAVRSFRWLRSYRAAKAVSAERNLQDAKVLEPEAAPVPDSGVDETGRVVATTVDDGFETTVANQAKLVDDLTKNLDERRASGAATKTAEKKLGVETRRLAKQQAELEARAAKKAEADAAAKKTEVEDQARATIEGEKVAETFHDVALRQLKASLNADPAKLRAVRNALESGDTQGAQELLDFNHTTVDWEGLAKQVGEGESVDEFVKIINSFSTVFEQEMKDAKGYQSVAETLARSVGTTADDVLKLGRDVKGGKGLAARMAGADTILYQSVQELRRLAAIAKHGSEKEMMALFRQMDLHSTLQATIRGSKAEIARALRQMQRVSTAHIDDFKEFDDLMRDATGLGGDQRRHLAQKIADLKDMNKINQLTRKTRWQRARDVWVEVYINGLLSGISTLMLNNASNTLKLIEGITERYFAAGLGAVRNAGRRALRKESLDRITFREANAYLYGTMQGLDAALRIPFGKLLKGDFKGIEAEDWGATFRAFVDEKPVLDTRMRVDADTRKAISMTDDSTRSIADAVRTLDASGVDLNAKAINSLGKLIRIPGRLILTSDEFFKQITYNQHLASRAYKDGDAIATSLGKKGKKREAIIERTHRNYREFPPEDVRFEAMDHARYQTFQSDLPNGIARDFETFINRHPMMKFVIPFYRTPVNIIKQTVFERTPLPFLKAHKSEILQRIAKGGPQGDIALARMATGTAFLGWSANMALSGKITGGGLSTTNLPNSEAIDDIPPYSYQGSDGRWYQYNRLEPMGMLLGLGADLALAAEWWEGDDDADFWEAASLAATVVTTNVTDKTWFKGVADLVGMIEDPKRYGPRYLNRQTATMITPFSALLRRINTDHDDLAREAWTWMDNWKASVPGFSDDLPVRYDMLGQPKYKRDYLGPAWASPVAAGVERDDPVYKEVARLAFDYRPPSKDLFGVGENVDNVTYSDVMGRKGTVLINGSTLHEQLETSMNSGLYLDMLSDTGKADMVKGIISSYLRAAKMEYLTDNPDYFDNVKQQKEAAARLVLQP